MLAQSCVFLRTSELDSDWSRFGGHGFVDLFEIRTKDQETINVWTVLADCDAILMDLNYQAIGDVEGISLALLNAVRVVLRGEL